MVTNQGIIIKYITSTKTMYNYSMWSFTEHITTLRFFTRKTKSMYQIKWYTLDHKNILKKTNFNSICENIWFGSVYLNRSGFNTDQPNIYHPSQLFSNVPWIFSFLQMISSSLLVYYQLHETLMIPVKIFQTENRLVKHIFASRNTYKHLMKLVPLISGLSHSVQRLKRFQPHQALEDHSELCTPRQ